MQRHIPTSSLFRDISAQIALGFGLLGASLVPLAGCENLPGGRTEQATVIGGAGGAAIGAVLAEENRLLGALIGGAIGAGGGYLIGAQTDWFEGDDDDDDNTRDEAREAIDDAQRDPATAAEARRADTADINDDGFVTVDEVIALSDAGLSDSEVIDRLEATDQVFDLNEEQRDYLLDAGVSRTVVSRLPRINQGELDRVLTQRDAR